MAEALSARVTAEPGVRSWSAGCVPSGAGRYNSRLWAVHARLKGILLLQIELLLLVSREFALVCPWSCGGWRRGV